MLGDVDDAKSYIEQVWFNRIRQAPLGASSKFYIILSATSGMVSRRRRKSFPNGSDFWLSIINPSGVISTRWPSISRVFGIQDEHIVGQAATF